MANSSTDDTVKALKQELGRELRRLREAAGLTQEALARHIGYHRVSVTQVEKGRQDPSRKFVERLDVALAASGQLLAIHQRLVEERARDMNRRQLLCQVTTLAAAAVPPIRQALLWRGNAVCGGVGKPLPLTTLQGELTLACRLRQVSKYTAVGHMLPGLLAQAQRSTSTYPADQRFSAYALWRK